MNLTLYSSSTTSYNIKLADCGTIDEWASGMGAGFSAVGGTGSTGRRLLWPACLQ